MGRKPRESANLKLLSPGRSKKEKQRSNFPCLNSSLLLQWILFDSAHESPCLSWCNKIGVPNFFVSCLLKKVFYCWIFQNIYGKNSIMKSTYLLSFSNYHVNFLSPKSTPSFPWIPPVLIIYRCYIIKYLADFKCH